MRIIADSCCDLNPEIAEKTKVELVPLTIQVNGKDFVDDENLDVDLLIENMRSSEEAPKTACPSPNAFMERYKGDESVFVVTLSSALSGTYESAAMAKELFLEEFGNKFIHVFDSLSASVGETLISMKISELIDKGLKELEIVEKVNSYIKGMKTFFTLESLDNLVKAGRIKPLVARVTSILNVKPIMGATPDGEIQLEERTIGSRKSFRRFVELIGEQGINLEERVLGIAHCNNLEKALKFKEEVLKRYKFKDIIIVKTAGISTVYANEGGIIVAF